MTAEPFKIEPAAMDQVLYAAGLCFVEAWRDRLFNTYGSDWQSHHDAQAERDAMVAFLKKLKAKTQHMRKVSP